MWWNINKRLYLCAENISVTPFKDYIYDIIFILETNLASKAIPKMDNYTSFSQPNLKYCTHGGIAVFVKNSISKKMKSICHLMNAM